jgi:hypothetical protein
MWGGKKKAKPGVSKDASDSAPRASTSAEKMEVEVKEEVDEKPVSKSGQYALVFGCTVAELCAVAKGKAKEASPAAEGKSQPLSTFTFLLSRL